MVPLIINICILNGYANGTFQVIRTTSPGVFIQAAYTLDAINHKVT